MPIAMIIERPNRLALYALAALLALLVLALPGQRDAAQAQANGGDFPYWGSLKDDEANARVGPSFEYRIRWVYKRKLLPVKVIKRYDGWLQIEDMDGSQGWMHERLVSKGRTAIVRGGVTDIRAEPDGSSRLLWRAAPGVVGKLGECDAGWCQFDIMGRAGWVKAADLWGVGKP